jgi:hypothetical protein
MYAFTAATSAVYNSFIPIYLKGTGFSDTLIGTLLALGPFVAILAQPFWGIAGDRAKSKNTIFRWIMFERGNHFLIFVGNGKNFFNDVILDEIAYTKFITVDMLPSSILNAIAQREKEPDRIHLVGGNNVSSINKEIINLNETPFLYPPDSFGKYFLNFVYSQDYRKIDRDTQNFINVLIERLGVKIPATDVEKKGLVEKFIECKEALFK